MKSSFKIPWKMPITSIKISIFPKKYQTKYPSKSHEPRKFLLGNPGVKCHEIHLFHASKLSNTRVKTSCLPRWQNSRTCALEEQTRMVVWSYRLICICIYTYQYILYIYMYYVHILTYINYIITLYNIR